MADFLVYDGRNDKCPLPLVTTKLLLKKLASGEKAVVHLKDPGSLADIPAWLQTQRVRICQKTNADASVTLTITKE
ncbi:sulfurtransferase TusA family protein [Thalassotalea sp. HSM 43]|uniref:sulfurtransferase TusA family protein n=1 Tax=Thalassotalea sp. HSM 43 TaxID=2552945 RepID=UPI0010816AD7|nr:sulfurtransferase TusA family protein [Thalassotalea sp. HSM 43]QBY05614.1 sulfurtransferase TusA family protein [Thalassotalea sp. HSM 43]